MSIYEKLATHHREFSERAAKAKRNYMSGCESLLSDIEKLWTPLGCGLAREWRVAEYISPTGLRGGKATITLGSGAEITVGFTMPGHGDGARLVIEGTPYALEGDRTKALVTAFSAELQRKIEKATAYVAPTMEAP
jgi:hypothetical protein